ncbi:hypothetical protein DOY81_014060, partial [Sarcophaga bullata]
MIDVKKTRNNFQKFPSLKQICNPEFQDKNFLKAECELAHAQVCKVPTTTTTTTVAAPAATEKNSNKTILPAINDKRFSHVNIRNTISSSNNNS